MKNKMSLFASFLLILSLISCASFKSKDSISVQLTNNTSVSLHDYTFEIKIDSSDFHLTGKYLQILSGNKLVASECIPVSNDSHHQRFFFQTDLPAASSIEVTLKSTNSAPGSNFPKKTLAELWYKSGGHFENKIYTGGEFQSFKSLRVPDECTDHSFFIKYEGPGWESDKIGYRLYLDWRNAIDIYGKKVNTMVLPKVGLDGYESYHEMADWGMDILKVGPSLGIGSIGYWNGKSAERVAETDSVVCEIVADGNLYSDVVVNYYGWKIADTSVDLQSSLSITAGSRATHHIAILSNDISNLCTGIVKLDSTYFFTGDSTRKWDYIATWGKQSLANDSLGMAVIFQRDVVQKITEDENNHVVVLTPNNKQVDYYLLAAWEQEPGGIKNAIEFVQYLNDFVTLLNTPVVIKIMK
jgi:hypothetical protein